MTTSQERMGHIECAECGLCPADQPIGAYPEMIFERADDGRIYCQVCTP